MRIVSIQPEAIHTIPFRCARATGGSEYAVLPVFVAIVDALPDSLDAIVCAGDLQGVEATVPEGQAARLLGVVLAEELYVLLELHDIAAHRTGVVLSGDLYSSPQADIRGASGDVRQVWHSFGERFRWVAGVLGNHYCIGSTTEDMDEFRRIPDLCLLDATVQEIDEIRIGGISGVIGSVSKPLRRPGQQYLAAVEGLRNSRPDLMVMHPSPAVTALNLRGSGELGEIYLRQRFPLTVCGHVSWPFPLAELPNGNQILNLDSRVVVLRAEAVSKL